MEFLLQFLLASLPILSFGLRLIRERRRAITRHIRKRRQISTYMRERRRRQRQRSFMLTMALSVTLDKKPRPRSIWVKPRSSSVCENMFVNFTDTDWKENFRVDRETFTFICDSLRPYIGKRLTVMRRPISVRTRVAITLWRLATNCEYRTLGNMFGVARNTACKIVHEVCSAINEVFREEYLKFPDAEEVVEIVKGFENRWGFPQCVGAIDGSHIPIISPTDHPADYYNRKGFHSIVLQAVVDFRYRFIDVNVGWPGQVHDARILSNSCIFRKAEAGTLLPNLCRTIQGQEVPIVILGDPAYPLLPWLMKGFSDTGRLTEGQKLFNYRLSRARMVVENAFGRLKGRWRCLMKRNDTSMESLPTQVIACCILHNLCESRRDHVNDNWLEEAEEYRQRQLHEDPHDGQDNTRAISSRDALVQYFVEGY
ncbi:putative nuclease HARBI1 [Apostichopus japonicus]|uniref:Putative nuclease HARBI1 n=1 Tax=Stichopus japonicus TaxID=307972 RepID=A0A2G8JY74_STIJA|nr:putative nuclease HARBI1 [Apostichopus japonicus]